MCTLALFAAICTLTGVVLVAGKSGSKHWIHMAAITTQIKLYYFLIFFHLTPICFLLSINIFGSMKDLKEEEENYSLKCNI